MDSNGERAVPRPPSLLVTMLGSAMTGYWLGEKHMGRALRSGDRVPGLVRVGAGARPGVHGRPEDAGPAAGRAVKRVDREPGPGLPPAMGSGAMAGLIFSGGSFGFLVAGAMVGTLLWGAWTLSAALHELKQGR